MGSKFDQWLAKPSTLHFLRRLVSIETCHHGVQTTLQRVPRQPCSCLQSRFYSASLISRKNAPNTLQDREKQDGERHDGIYHFRSHEHEELLRTANLGLRMSLNAGVHLLDKNIPIDQSFSELRFQADVNSERHLGKLLVDEPTNADNIKLWVEILSFRQRLDGLQGVMDVWRGMRRRNMDLPVAGEDAELLWTTFLYAAVPTSEVESNDPSHNFLVDVFDYAVDLKSRGGQNFAGLHKCIVGRFLRSPSSQSVGKRALAWNKRLSDAGLTAAGDLHNLVEDAIRSPRSTKALHSFRWIYLKSEQRNLYNPCVSEALRCDDDAAALFLHQVFMSVGDGPSTEMFATEGVQRLFALDKDKSLPMARPARDKTVRLNSSESEILKAQLPRMTRASMNTIVGDVHGIKPKEISDHFCARLFATRAFSIDLVIKALSMFGIDKLGPLALREMALRSGSPMELGEKLTDLKTYGVSLRKDVYSQLLARVVKDEQMSIWNVLMHSDQHPEAYEDVATQEALLASFLEEHKWAQAHISLLALSLAGAQSSIRGWNLLLQHYLQHREYRPMLNTFQSMQSQGIPLLPLTIRDIFWHLLPERQRSKRPIKGHGPKFFDPLDFVTNALIYAAEHGANVTHLRWQELLKRYGMDHRWDDVERLVLWLVNQYSKRKSAFMLGLDKHRYLHRKRVYLRARTLPLALNAHMRKALFVWGFRSASIRDQLKPLESRDSYIAGPPQDGLHENCEPWARGLALLRRLNQDDITFPTDDIRKAFVLRMWILFGPAYSTLGLNNEARRGNQLSLAHYIRRANEVWDGLIHWVNPELLQPGRENDPRLLTAFFGPVKRVNSKTREYADVTGWAKLSSASRVESIYERHSTPSKQEAWDKSGLRLYLPLTNHGKQLLPRKQRLPNDHLPQEHQSLAVHAKNSRPPPSQLYTPAQS